MVKFPTPQELKNTTDKTSIQEIILGVLGVGALLTVLFVAPNLIQIVDMFGNKRVYSRKRFRSAVRRMEKLRYIQRRSSDKTCWKFSLTKRGSEILKKQKIETLTIQKPKHWDGKWRLVIFDIPETLKRARHAFRWKLKHLGFHYLNLSVWIYPYPCSDEINAITEYYDVGRYTRLMVVETFDGEQPIKKSFQL